MQIKNTQTEYGLIARIFHWGMAALIAVLVLVGLFMTDMAYSPEKLELYALHKSFGLLVLFLILGRRIWRFASPSPRPLGTHQNWEKALAKIVHVFFYLALAALPLSGWLMSSAGEFPVPFFGLQMPDLTGKNEALFDVMKAVHGSLALILLAVLALHIAGAFKHHMMDRDETLTRMASGLKPVPVLLLTVAGVFFVVAGSLWLKGQGTPVQETAASSFQPGNPDHLSDKGWVIVPEKSSLAFEAQMYGTAFTGAFHDFGGTILFDPDNLKAAKADIRMDMSSVVTGNKDRDSQILTADWFDVETFPEARFESLRFEAAGEGRYIVIGTLTIRDVSLPVSLPFTLTIQKDSEGRDLAEMEGTLTLNRLDFGIGQGEWQDTKTVADRVSIKVSLTAFLKP